MTTWYAKTKEDNNKKFFFSQEGNKNRLVDLTRTIRNQLDERVGVLKQSHVQRSQLDAKLAEQLAQTTQLQKEKDEALERAAALDSQLSKAQAINATEQVCLFGTSPLLMHF